MSLRNVLRLPTTPCACADFWDFAKQCNGGGSREKDLLSVELHLAMLLSS
jgi:hypothetical protein